MAYSDSTGVLSLQHTIVWHMLTNGENYRYDKKKQTRIKLLRLNKLAGGVNIGRKVRILR